MRVEQIFADSRTKMRALAAMQNPSERRKHAERIRAESRNDIAAVLRPEQRVGFERIVAELFGTRSSAGRVWVLDAEGQPTPIDVRLGLSDGGSSEIESTKLAEGQQVIVGFARTESSAPVQRRAMRLRF